MGLPRQEYWSGLPFPSPGDLLDPGIEFLSPALAGGFFTPELPGKPLPSLLLPFSSLILPCDMIIVFLSYIPYRVKLLKLDLVPYFIFSKKNSNLCLAVLGFHWCAGFSGCGAQASHCGGFSLWRLLLLRSTALGLAGFSSCST